MLRRISFLLSSYGSGNPNLNYTEIIQRAKSVKMIDNNLKWYNWSRYSERQDRKMKMGGLIGSVIYEGNLEEFIPFIQFCSKVHIGKQTTFGLGKIRWQKME
ncbi:CRISPR-associated protein Cas6 domain containing protein [Candidatus Magnetomorum sp. HK-1]|nr:CRISPR-associated protein Cas6 domain containing protein [Candidatus Magnetomorum sp. HK-1]